MPRTIQPSRTLLATLDRQDGVASMSQLVAGGYTRRAVDNRVQRGRWRRLLPGVILTVAADPSRRQLLVAGWLWGGPDAAVDGADACAWYGLVLDGFNPSRVHLVTPASSTLRSRDFVTVRRACAEIEVGARGLVPYVDPATAVIVAARCARTPDAAIAVLSRALQTGLVDVHQLRDARERLGDKWCRSVDSALATVGVGVRSPLERRNRDLILTSDVLPEPRWNQWLDLGDGGPWICADALWEEAGMVEEVLGKRYHGWGEQFEDTEARRARVVAAGLVTQGATAGQIREGKTLLDRLERTYLRNAGRGLPAGVRLVPAPQSRNSDALWAVSRD